MKKYFKKNFYKNNSTLKRKQISLPNKQKFALEEDLEKILEKERLNNNILNQKIKFLHIELSKIEEENKQLKNELKEIFQKQEKYKEELLKTISQQRSIIEDKHLYTSILEQKIKKLMGEIKNILKLEKTLSFKQSSYQDLEENSQTSSRSCKKFVEHKINTITKDFIACSENFNFISPSKNSVDSFINTHSINYRVFFEKLRKDDKHAIFFYSEQQNKIIFINDLFLSWIGGNPNFLPNPFSNNNTKENDTWFSNNHVFKKNTEGFVEIKTKKRGFVTFYYIVKKISTNNLSFYSVGILLPLNNKNC